MNIIFILVPIALVFVTLGVALFFWAVKSDQFDDLDRQGYSILFDEDKPRPEQNQQSSEQQDKAGDH